jgi:hypothetical protein
MKILFITNADGPDYLSDMVFHGGKSIFGKNFYESKKLWYMYDDLQNKENLYGRGFTIYGKIKSYLYSPILSNIAELIKDKFFDKIIYGSVWRCLDFLDLVFISYSKDDVIFIDGEDHSYVRTELLNKGNYFKREYYEKIDGVNPISFSIPEELIVDKIDIKSKIKLFSDIIPNSNQNYQYYNELDYYKEYYNSWYGITQKKGGWDCLRHYEIMMNGCIPLFTDLDKCPNLTLTSLPKKELIEMSKKIEQNLEYNNYILDYVRNNLTTKNTIKKII